MFYHGWPCSYPKIWVGQSILHRAQVIHSCALCVSLRRVVSWRFFFLTRWSFMKISISHTGQSHHVYEPAQTGLMFISGRNWVIWIYRPELDLHIDHHVSVSVTFSDIQWPDPQRYQVPLEKHRRSRTGRSWGSLIKTGPKLQRHRVWPGGDSPWRQMRSSPAVLQFLLTKKSVHASCLKW